MPIRANGKIIRNAQLSLSILAICRACRNPITTLHRNIQDIQEKYKYTISYEKAWSAKQKVLEIRFGTFEAAYDNISRLLAIICQRNPGSYYDLKSLNRGQDPPFILQRAFFSLGPCINAFQHCRSILCIDGTFLTGKYRGQMLTATAADGNNQLLSVAFAFVESENTDS
jgi:hypothetical protein